MIGPDSINKEGSIKSSTNAVAPSITIYQKLKELQELRSKKIIEDSTISAAAPASVDLHQESQQLLESLKHEFEDKNIKLQLQQFYDDALVIKEEDTAALEALPNFNADNYYPEVFAKLLPYMKLICSVEGGNPVAYAHKLAMAFSSEKAALTFLDEEFNKSINSEHPLADACNFTLNNVGRQYWNYAPDVAGMMMLFVENRAHELLDQHSPFYKSVYNKAQCWQPLIQAYFPHLQTARPEEYNNTPRTLFEDQYQFCIDQLGYANKQDVLFLLSSLRGDLTAVRSADSSGTLIAMDLIAMANGHFTEELDKSSRLNKGYVFMIAAGLGNLSVVLKLLPQVDGSSKGIALGYAAQNGHLAVVQELLIRVGGKISDFCKGSALSNAAEKGHLAVVLEILTRFGKEIDKHHKKWALDNAARNGHLAVVQELLTRVGAEIPDGQGLVLDNAARNGHLAVVRELLTSVDSQIYASYKRSALQYAARNGHFAVVRELLANVDGEISDDDKRHALKLASEKGHLAVVQVLSDHMRPTVNNIFQSVGGLFVDLFKNVSNRFTRFFEQTESSSAATAEPPVDSSDSRGHKRESSSEPPVAKRQTTKMDGDTFATLPDCIPAPLMITSEHADLDSDSDTDSRAANKRSTADEQDFKSLRKRRG